MDAKLNFKTHLQKRFIFEPFRARLAAKCLYELKKIFCHNNYIWLSEVGVAPMSSARRYSAT
jgi:hypothetical protein